jgi:glycerol-1-phosphatase
VLTVIDARHEPIVTAGHRVLTVIDARHEPTVTVGPRVPMVTVHPAPMVIEREVARAPGAAAAGVIALAGLNQSPSAAAGRRVTAGVKAAVALDSAVGVGSPLISAYDLLLLDLDGVVYRGGQSVIHAVESIQAVQSTGIPVAYVTNNSSRTPAEVTSQLRGFGLELDERDVVSSAQTAVRMLQSRLSHGKVYVVGGEGLRAAARDAGFELVDSAADNPNAVLQGYSADVGWRELAEASFAIQAGAIWIATNQDWTLPLERGLAPGNGTLVSAVHTAVGILPDFAGKPATPIFEEAVSRFGAQRPLFVGDRLDTDSRGANAAGIENAIVLTGVATRKELVGAREEDRPNFIFDDLRALLSEYPTFKHKRGVVRGEGVEAEMFGNRVLMAKGDPASTAALRATCELVWNASVAVYALDVDPKIYEQGRINE